MQSDGTTNRGDEADGCEDRNNDTSGSSERIKQSSDELATGTDSPLSKGTINQNSMVDPTVAVPDAADVAAVSSSFSGSQAPTSLNLAQEGAVTRS